MSDTTKTVRVDTHTCQLCGNSYSGKHVCPAFYGDGCGPAFDADGEPIQRLLATADIPVSRLPDGADERIMRDIAARLNAAGIKADVIEVPHPASNETPVWDDEDDQNIAGLIRICEDLKTRLVPCDASPEGWDSALTTLHRVKRLARALR